MIPIWIDEETQNFTGKIGLIETRSSQEGRHFSDGHIGQKLAKYENELHLVEVKNLEIKAREINTLTKTEDRLDVLLQVEQLLRSIRLKKSMQ